MDFNRLICSKYEQIYTVPLTRKVYPMEFDGPYKHNDGLGTPVVSTATVRPDTNDIYIEARGGGAGLMTTTIHMVNGELWLTQTLPEKKGIQNSRVFHRKP